jgi:hypothetical protein
MTQHDNEGSLSLSEHGKAGSDQQRSDHLTLKLGANTHRSQTPSAEGSAAGFNVDGGEENVSYDGVAVDGDEGEAIWARPPKPVHKIGFGSASECCGEHRAHRSMVRLLFFAD